MSAYVTCIRFSTSLLATWSLPEVFYHWKTWFTENSKIFLFRNTTRDTGDIASSWKTYTDIYHHYPVTSKYRGLLKGKVPSGERKKVTFWFFDNAFFWLTLKNRIFSVSFATNNYFSQIELSLLWKWKLVLE